MRSSIRSDVPAPRFTWWSRVGGAGFALFLVKGLLWLLAPVLFALVR